MLSNREIFFKAVFLGPPLLCGKRLRPFSIAHEYFLKRLKSPYVVGGECAKDDLLLAIHVCSLTYGELKSALNDGKHSVSKLWCLLWSLRSLETAEESFRLYLMEHYDVPDHFEKVENLPSDISSLAPETAKKESYAAPFEYHLVHVLCSQYNCTLDEAWNMPLTTARCYYDVWSESTGYDDSLVPVSVGAPLKEVAA